MPSSRVKGRATSRGSRYVMRSISKRVLSRRIRAGLTRARAAGIPLGRPAAQFNIDRARRLQKLGWSVRAIAARMGVPKSTLADRLLSAPP